MERARTIAGYFVFALNTLLLVFFLFGDRMQFPAWLQSFGRMHPLLLHLPIGGVILLVILYFSKKQQEIFNDLVLFTALLAALTAVMGFVLAGEGGYDNDTLSNHKLWSIIFSYALALASMKDHPSKLVIIAPLVAVLVAGHYGSVLTHGDDFIFEPLISKKENTVIVSDSTSLFATSILPLLDQKCASCHNEKKKKGDLILSTAAGVNHALLKKSPIIKRILLPENHKDHMPPAGKAQLGASEVQLLYQWILSGADTAKAWTKYDPSDSVRKLTEQYINSERPVAKAQYTFSPASQETIEGLNDPYRTVAPIALNEPALAATFFIRTEYKSSKLEELTSVKDQLVALNLSKMPVTDEDCGVIRKLTQLEKLNLNFSSITVEGLKSLASLPELRSLSLAGTALDGAAMNALKDFKKLKEVFVWNTPAVTDIANLEKEIPTVAFNTGFIPDANERLRLTPPIPVADKTLFEKSEKMVLTHKLPGVAIRYTTNGQDPDSTSNVLYDGPFTIDGYTTVKTLACKDGWFCSPVGTFVVYTKGAAPLETKLLTVANKDYKGEGAATFSNNKKGYTDDHRDIAWIGFRENPMSAAFKFAPGTNIKNITFSYDHNSYGWLFPPQKVEVWAGKDDAHLTLIKQLKPEQPQKLERTRNAALVIPIDGAYETYKIIAWPVPELPRWHPSNNPKTKDKRAWLFVDEVIFGQ